MFKGFGDAASHRISLDAGLKSNGLFLRKGGVKPSSRSVQWLLEAYDGTGAGCADTRAEPWILLGGCRQQAWHLRESCFEDLLDRSVTFQDANEESEATEQD